MVRNKIKFLIILLLFALCLFIDVGTGNSDISVGDFFRYFFATNDLSVEKQILIHEFRIPRVMIAVLAGASLSVAGLIMQTIFRNPLAGPYILGVSNGAGLGVAVVILSMSGYVANIPAYALLIAAAAGSALILSLILAIALRVKDILSILIIGVLISGVVSSIVSILQYYASEVNVKAYLLWTMGSLSAVSFSDIVILLPLILTVVAVGMLFSKKLNLLLPGENFARSLGVNLRHIRILSFVIVSILAGTITAYCGPLGFIGIAAPHIARWIFNTSNHFILIPASFVIGACFMLCSDILSIAVVDNGILPINAITAIMGTPFIIWIVIKNKRTMV